MYNIKMRMFLKRKYIYAILFTMFFVVLLIWNSPPDPNRTGFFFQNGNTFIQDNKLITANASIPNEEQFTYSIVKPASKALAVDDKNKFANFMLDISDSKFINTLPKVKGNVVSLIVYMESRCPDTTGFVRRHLVPTFEKLKATRRVNYVIVPFGKANCQRTTDDFFCKCQHGPTECFLNQLMNCVIDRLPSAMDFVPIIGCVQGKNSLEEALQNCLAQNPELEWLRTCAASKRGRFLHALAGEHTARLGDDFNFVPWIVLDGKRVNDAFYALEENICKRLEAPKPAQCEHFL